MLELPNELEAYLIACSEPEPEILMRLTRATHLQVLRPRMLSGPLQGALLRMLCRLTAARRVLEVGTYTGYAAISMAYAVGEGGVVHTIDNDEELEDFTRRFVEESGVADRISLHTGDARQVIPTLDGPFDLVYLDADKRQYTEYYRAVIDRVRPGGLIVADDVLWDGKVLDAAARDVHTEAIRLFNQTVRNDNRVETVMLPLRHGLTLIRKKDTIR